MTVDAPDYVGTTALHHGKYTVFNAGTQVIAPGATYNTGNIAFTKPGYWIFANAQMAANTVTPFVLVEVFWRDSATGTTFDDQQWVMPAGTAAALRIAGRGPVTGDQCQITFTNLDATQNVTLKAIITETTHAIARHDWRSIMNANWTTTALNTTPAPGAVFSATLFQGNPTVPATTTHSYLMGLYPGQVQFQTQDAGATPLNYSIQPVANLQTSLSATAVYAWTGAVAGVHGNFILPRQPCFLAVNNPNAAGVQFTANLTLLEYAS